MTWNHRVVRKVDAGEEYFGIHEVYYENGDPVSVTVDSVSPFGETLEELTGEIDMFKAALSLPVLDFDKIPNPHHGVTGECLVRLINAAAD